MTNSLIFPHLIHGAMLREILKQTNPVPSTGFPVVDHWVDKDGQAHVALALAGYRPEDLDVSVEGSTLTISSGGAESDDDTGGTRRIARRAFRTTFSDPENVYNLSSLDASFINGELKVVIPRKEEAKAKTFKIRTKQLTA